MMLHTESSETSSVRVVPTKVSLKWGILSAGRISHDFVTALGTLPSDEHTVICVADLQLESAEKFATTHNIPRVFESYEAVAKCTDIEIVYIGAANPEHYAIVSLMLNNGKHVLCEKPLCMNAAEVKQLTDTAKEKRLFLMEGIWSRFFPSYQYVKRKIDAGALGDIEEITVEYGIDLAIFIRNNMTFSETRNALTMDAVQLFQWVFRQYPMAIEVIGGEAMNATQLAYSDGRMAKISFTGTVENSAIIRGSTGTIVV